MNQLQEKEFNLFICFKRVCEELDIKYFMVCGSALGAVKYEGFIPWDDDLDVGLFREDYKRFIKEAPRYLPDDIFLQTYESDPSYPNIFAKLRDSRTTYIEKSVAAVPMNHGIYIDIFPLDGYPTDTQEQHRLEKRKLFYKRVISCAYSVNRSVKGKIAVYLMRLIGLHKHTQWFLSKYEKLISAYPIKDSELICNHGNWQGKLEYAPKWHYGEGKWATFEEIKVRIPKDYDAYLTQKYGDWRTDLPVEQQKGHHYYEICDVTRPYTDYLCKLNSSK